MKPVSISKCLILGVCIAHLLISCSSSKSVGDRVVKKTVAPLTTTASSTSQHATDKNVGSKKLEANRTFTLTNISDRPYLGIGIVIDSANNLSRSFALFELFQKNLLINNKDTLYPVIVDYPFNSPNAITGVFNGNNVKIKIYKNGKKVEEVIASKEWKDIYTRVAKVLTNNKEFKSTSKFTPVNEGAVDNVDARKIKDCMPGSIELQVPYSKIVDTLRRYAHIKYYRYGTPYTNNKELYGKYNTYNENKVFFFRNDNVPYNLKNAAKPLVFPLYKSLTPCLTYLSSGKILADEGDYGASLNSYYSALITSNNILASPFERALIRELAYQEISKTHKLLSSIRTQSALLFQLGSDLNKAYVGSQDANVKRDEYYENVSKIQDLCTKAEDKAREIRGQKRLGGFLAAVSYAGALSSTSAYDNTASDALMSQAGTYLTASSDQANMVSEALTKQYEKIEDKIDAKSFITSDGSKMELGRSFLAGEVYYYLSTNPDVIKSVLFSYAADKPKLLALINSFYSGKNDNSILNDIFSHVSEMEAKIVNAEVRNVPVTEKILSTL